MQRATYSLLTPPSWLRRPPNHAPSFLDPATVRAQIMTPDVRRSRRFEAVRTAYEATVSLIQSENGCQERRAKSDRRTVDERQAVVVLEDLEERVEVVPARRVHLRACSRTEVKEGPSAGREREQRGAARNESTAEES